MKILHVDQIREADAYTIRHTPIASIDLMERAAGQLAQWIHQRIGQTQRILLFTGPGNNGGDGLALARLLWDLGHHQIALFPVHISDQYSPDYITNLERLDNYPKIQQHPINTPGDCPDLQSKDLIIDGLFGSGLSRPISGLAAEVINRINASTAAVIAIDVPSGLLCDQSVKNNKGPIIKADFTLSFQLPKHAFLFPENETWVGNWQVLDIGLHPDFLAQAPCKHYYLELQDAQAMHRPRTKFAHKGNFGHGLLIAGSTGKMGAALLAAQAALRSGLGLLSCRIPKNGQSILQTALPEAMLQLDENPDSFSSLPPLDPFSAVGIGPGLGTGKQTANALKLLIQNCKVPMVFDADAINILAANKTWLHFIAPLSIFTPHPKEFERLVGKAENNFIRNQQQKDFSIKHKVYVALKGAHTAISCPDGTLFYNSTGNPGMATGGSGDVLTGIILGLLAQAYHPKTATLLGVYIHGLAGDIAMQKGSMESLIASDITKKLGKAFQQIQ